MGIITWSNDYSVRVKELDNQHHKLFDLVNDLHESMRIGKGKAIIESVLNGLVDYAKTHLAYEEQLMKSHGYSGYASQKMAHDALTRQVSEYVERHKEGKITTIEIMGFLKDWLTKHILGSDKMYSKFFNDKGVF